MENILVYYQTTDYGKFKFLDFNRTMGSNKMLSKSIELVDMTAYVPIVVTPDFYIIDGQNRFSACKEKGLPITYVIYDGNPEIAMIALNTALKPWKQQDWLAYHVGKKNNCYMKLQRMFLKNTAIGISNAILLFSNGSTNAKMFREGKLNDKSEYYNSVVDFISSIDVPRDVRWYRAFVRAVLIFFVKYGNDKKKIDKLAKKIGAITKYSRIDDYVMAFENWVR